MNKTESTPTWSSEETKLLNHELFINELLKTRIKQTNDKSLRQYFLDPLVIATIITVIAGGVITFFFQVKQKDREFQQAWIKTQGEYVIDTHRVRTQKELDLIQQIYKLVGNCVAASEDMLLLTLDRFDPGTYPNPIEKEKIRKDRETIRNNFNNALAQWRTEKDGVGYMMNYYHQGETDLTNTWSNTQKSIADFMACAETELRITPLGNHNDEIKGSLCKTEKETLRAALGKFSDSLESSRKISEKAWQLPSELKATLNRDSSVFR